ncbi:MAG: thioesterase family protein [Thermofilum sp.]
MPIERGSTYSRRFTVKAENTAKHIDAGGLRVLATPSLVGFVEETCRILADQHLPAEFTTVGVRVEIHHVKPAPEGAEVEVRVQVLHADERRILFWAEAWSGVEMIGYAFHERAIVSREEFARKVRTLLASRAGG